MLLLTGFNLGYIDLVQGGSFREVVGRSVCALLLHIKDKEGRRVFPRATIVLPPVSATKHTEGSVLISLAQAVKELRRFELDEQEKPILRRLVRVVSSPSLEVADLLLTLQEQGARYLVAVADASQYRDSSLDLPTTFGITAIRVDEDCWAPHVASICRQFVSM